MRLILVLLAILLPTPVFAHAALGFAPPARYQQNPKMPTTIVALPVSKIGKHCSAFKRWYNIVYGCAVVRENPRRCIVFIPDKSVPNVAWPVGGAPILTPKMIFAHEVGHCNGWSASHSD